MNPSLKTFIRQIFILTLFLLIAGYALFLTVLKNYYFPLFPLIPVFFLAISLGVYAYLIRISQKDDKKFINSFLVTTGIKLLVYILFLVIILLADRKHVLPFLLTFLFMYILYTTVDVFSIINYLKNSQ